MSIAQLKSYHYRQVNVDDVNEIPNKEIIMMIAYCGLDCSTCIGYLATQSGDENEMKKVAEIWSAQHNATVLPEHVICDGCKAGKRKSFHCSNSCTINKCCMKKGHESCIECSDFACDSENFILDNVPEAKGNLESLRK